jgi:flotillin
VQKELDQFGLRIYNANVKELQDLGDSKYFESLSRKAHQGAQSQAEVDVALAQGRSKQEIAKINANTSVAATERTIEKSNAEQKLRQREIVIARELKLEQIAADRAAEQRDAELQRVVEEKRAAMELEKQRATKVTRAKIERESAQEQADAELYSAQQRSNAVQYDQKADAEAAFYRTAKAADAHYYKLTKEAEAMLAAKEKEAEAIFIAKKREAEGITEMAKAYGNLADVLGGPQGLMQYLMLKEGTLEKLAEANGRAIHGLQPKINVWTTGNSDGSSDPLAPIQNLYRALPPLFAGIQDQTGMTPPNWMINMPSEQQVSAKKHTVA